MNQPNDSLSTMMPASEDADIKPLSSAIAAPIIKVYRAGGFALAFAFIGTFLLSGALIAGPSTTSYIVGGVGAIIVLAVLCLFYFYDLKRLSHLKQTIDSNQELLDGVQATSLQMTELAFLLQSLAFKNADHIATTLTKIRDDLNTVLQNPMIKALPFSNRISELANHDQVARVHALSEAIVSMTDTSKNVISNVRQALEQSDPEPLKEYLEHLKNVTDTTRKLLKT